MPESGAFLDLITQTENASLHKLIMTFLTSFQISETLARVCWTLSNVLINHSNSCSAHLIRSIVNRRYCLCIISCFPVIIICSSLSFIFTKCREFGITPFRRLLYSLTISFCIRDFANTFTWLLHVAEFSFSRLIKFLFRTQVRFGIQPGRACFE